jgi:hypothetical protein
VGTIRTLGDPDAELEKFLTNFGASIDDLRGQVTDVFGPVLHAVASGSVAAGYANPTSDLDLYVIVDNPGVSDVPIVSHELGPLIDIFHLDAANLRRELDGLADARVARTIEGEPRERWWNTRETVGLASRLAIGAVLCSTPDWAGVEDWLRGDWLTARVADWWRDEAWRRLTLARWLGTRRPRMAVQDAVDAGMAALQVVTTEAGFVYFAPKWTIRELRALERPDLIELYRWLLTESANPDRDEAFVDRVATEVERLAGPPPADLTIEVSFLPAVERRELRGRTALWRWEMDGTALDVTGLPEPDSSEVVWRGAVGEAPPAWLADLLACGLVWMGASRADVR